MIRILLLTTLLLTIVFAMQECGMASNGANGNTLANANGNNNAMVENANVSNGPTTNPPTTNPGNSSLPPGGASGPAGGPPSGGNPSSGNK